MIRNKKIAAVVLGGVKTSGPANIRWQRAWIIFRIRSDLREGDMSGCADELLELPVSNWNPVNQETVYDDQCAGASSG